MITVSDKGLKRLAEIKRLRSEAAHCRRLAAGAVPFAVAQDLERLATDYERRATALENGTPRSPTRRPPRAA